MASAADVLSIWGGARGTIILKSNGTPWIWGAKVDGSVRMWGANDQGQCGNGTTNATSSPTRVSGFAARVGLP